MNASYSFDVFLSHSSQDRTAVRAIAERLRGDGVKVWLDDWMIQAGDSIPGRIERGIQQSRVLVPCMSAHALDSQWAQMERYAFQFIDPMNQEQRVIPLRLDDTPVPGMLNHLSHVDWRGPNREEEYARLLHACRRTDPSTAADPGAIAGVSPDCHDAGSERPPSNIPSLGTRPFLGRDALLQELGLLLPDPRRESVVILHGHAGVGKSELAREFARRNRARYRGGTFFIDASKDAIPIDLARIGELLLQFPVPANLPVSDKGQRTFFQLAAQPVLLIYDNVLSPDSVSPWLPAAGMSCHVLITTLIDGLESVLPWPCIEVPPLAVGDSIELVRRLAGNETSERHGRAIHEGAGGLPIQIVSTALFLRQERRRGRIATPPELAEAAARSFEVAYSRLPHSSCLLLHASRVLNPQRIPLAELRQHLALALSWSEAETLRALDACVDLHLLDPLPDPRMHQVFAAFLRRVSTPEADQANLAGIREVQQRRFHELAGLLCKTPSRADVASLLISYPVTVAAWAEFGRTFSAAEELQAGMALSGIGRFEEALTWFFDCERRLASTSDADTRELLAQCLEEGCNCLIGADRYDEARTWIERAIPYRETPDESGRIDHARLGICLHHAGFCLSSTGCYEDARKWFERAAAEAGQGDLQLRVDHESLASSLHQVGYCLASMSKPDEALEWFLRAVEEAESGNPEGRVDHASLGVSLHEVGCCHLSLQHFEAAMPWFDRAIEEARKGDLYGRIDHRSAGSSMHRMAECLAAEGRLAEARQWFERALEAKQQGNIYGRLDPESIAATLHDGSMCLAQAGLNELAAQWERQAAEIVADQPGHSRDTEGAGESSHAEP